jgi:aminoglycoside phosphotransferase family enzyme/predicted kinase
MNETRMLSAQEERSSPRDFSALLNALSRPGAYPFTLPGDGPISIIQTHASAVLLTPDRVYKLKKPKDFGFFDYSTPALRRHFCGQEVRLNRRLAPQVYLGVAPVLEFSDGQVRFGPTYHPDDVLMPGSTLDGGNVVDYAVVMVRLPDEAMLESRVRYDTASPALLAEIARYVAAFHASTQTDERVASFGLLDVIRGNWEENFAQMRPYIGRTLDAPTYNRIRDYICRFLDERASLFASRVRDHRIRDCHGDLRLQHIYILDAEHDPTPRLAILDGIEFNERFRYGDVASEIAFLTMELDATGRCDLSRAFVKSYIAETGDETLLELLPFYACYRACVRGKVLSFQLDEPEVPEPQQELARLQAASLFAQAASYASGPTRPTLLLVGGLMGVGKSTLALALQQELGWALFSSDAVRKHLAHLDPAQPRADAFGQSIYSPAWTAHTYRTLLHEASAALANGRSVLIDASFLRRTGRLATARAAAAHGANAMFVECVCPREVSLERLARRWKLHTEGNQGLDEESLRASDGRPDLYDAQCAVYEPFVSAEEPGTGYLAISTTLPLVVNVEQVLDALHTPRFACWL